MDNKKAKRKDRAISFLIALGFAVTAGILLWPSFMESWNNITQTSMIGTYEDSLAGTDVEQVRAQAEAYNRMIAERQKLQPFSYQGAVNDDAVYNQSLRASEDSATMGFIEIGKIGVYLPITHSTNAQDLEYQAGHMYGTSLPVGGAGTHAVIAGHTGLKAADLFTNLTDMEEGDEFRIHVLGDVLVYTVDRITVCYPEEEELYLQVEDGRDLVTLYTCTPYGVNDRRLLVRGTRTGTEQEEADYGEQMTATKNRDAIIRTVLFGSVPFLVIIGWVAMTALKAWKERRMGVANTEDI